MKTLVGYDGDDGNEPPGSGAIGRGGEPLRPGQAVTIVDGSFKGFDGIVDAVDEVKRRVRVRMSMFGRETPIELDFLQVEKLD
jgi:transcription antitermination factor NusG